MLICYCRTKKLKCYDDSAHLLLINITHIATVQNTTHCFKAIFWLNRYRIWYLHYYYSSCFKI